MSKQENKFAKIVKALEVVEASNLGELKGGFQSLDQESLDGEIVINIYQCGKK